LGVLGQLLSNWVYYFKGAPQTLVGDVFKRILCATINIFFNLLDKINKNKEVTLGYIIVAKK